MTLLAVWKASGSAPCNSMPNESASLCRRILVEGQQIHDRNCSQSPVKRWVSSDGMAMESSPKPRTPNNSTLFPRPCPLLVIRPVCVCADHSAHSPSGAGAGTTRVRKEMDSDCDAAPYPRHRKGRGPSGQQPTCSLGLETSYLIPATDTFTCCPAAAVETAITFHHTNPAKLGPKTQRRREVRARSTVHIRSSSSSENYTQKSQSTHSD